MSSRPWPLRWAIALVLAVAGLAVAASRFVRATPHLGLSPDALSLALIGVFALVYAIELGLIAFGANRLGGRFAESLGMRIVPDFWNWIGIAIGAGFALRAASILYSAFMLAMKWRLPGWNTSPIKYFPPGFAGGVAMVLIVCVAAPVVEESIFRGVLMPSLSARFGQAWGVGISSVVFAVMHLNPFNFVPILVVGFVLAQLVIRSRSLWVSIACHATFNLIGVVVVLLLRGNGVV